MLRLNFSKISLDRKDLEYHTKTHQRRQAARGYSLSPDQPSRRRRDSGRSINPQKGSPVQFPTKNLTKLPLRSLHYDTNDNDAIISWEPVPRGSKTFWDKVLAEAGTPTRTKDTCSGNGKMVEPSEEWLENHRSSRASISSEDDQMLQDEISGVANMSHGLSSRDSFSYTPMKALDSIPRRKGVTASLESMRHSTKQHRLSNLFRRRPRSSDAIEDFQQHEVPNLGLDGHQSDMPQQAHDREHSASSTTSHAQSISDGLYGNRRDRRTISSSLETSVIHTLMPDQIVASKRAQIPYISTTAESQHPTRTFSRSPLHISEVVIPPSPRSGPQNVSFEELPNLASLHVRRPRTYRPRSETYPYDISEASSATTQINDGPSAPANPRSQDSRPAGPEADPIVISATSLFSRSISRSPAISPHVPRTPPEVQDHRVTSQATRLSNLSLPFASSRSSTLSPLAPSFLPPTTSSRNLTPHYQLPPPFGSTPRTVSYSQVLPNASSPTAPFIISTPDLSHQTSPKSNATPARLPTTPPRSSFRVYDDSEPPQTQPQTPADLHRRRRINFQSTIPANRAHPAPVERGLAQWQAFASHGTRHTPTRLRPEVHPVRMEEIISRDIENEDTITLSERHTRRAWNGALRIGGEERRELDLSPGLMGRRLG